MYDLDKENKLFKKKILDSYTDFEDFKKNFQDFHKLSEEAIRFVYRFFVPLKRYTIIKAIVGWVIVTIILNYLKKICFWFLFAYGWVREWDIFTNSIGSMTIGEIIGGIGSFLGLFIGIGIVSIILTGSLYNLYRWCFCIDAEEEGNE